MFELKAQRSLSHALRESAEQIMPDESVCQQIFCSVMQTAGITISESLDLLCAATQSMTEMTC